MSYKQYMIGGIIVSHTIFIWICNISVHTIHSSLIYAPTSSIFANPRANRWLLSKKKNRSHFPVSFRHAMHWIPLSGTSTKPCRSVHATSESQARTLHYLRWELRSAPHPQPRRRGGSSGARKNRQTPASEDGDATALNSFYLRCLLGHATWSHRSRRHRRPKLVGA